MQKTISDAQLRELLKSGAAAYQERQNELNTRERHAQRTLDMMIEVMQPLTDYLQSLNVPANLKRSQSGIVFDVGQPPNLSGQLLVKVTPEFKLVITERAITGDGNIGMHEQPPRDPSDFGAPHWRAELARALAWMLGEGSSDHSAPDEDDDED